GLKLAKGPKRALVSLALRRLWIRLRGLDFTERDADVTPESELLRIDACWSVAAGLGAVDLIRGADFQSLHLLLALRSGEISRIARAMAFEVSQTAARGGRAQKHVAELLEKTDALAKRAAKPHSTGMAVWARGLSSYLLGNWREAAEYCEHAAEILRDECTGATWELTIANRFMLSALLYRGEVAEVSRRVPQLLSAALDQGNLFAATDLRARLALASALGDQRERRLRIAANLAEQITRENMAYSNPMAMLIRAGVANQRGDEATAVKLTEQALKEFEAIKMRLYAVAAGR